MSFAPPPSWRSLGLGNAARHWPRIAIALCTVRQDLQSRSARSGLRLDCHWSDRCAAEEAQQLVITRPRNRRIPRICAGPQVRRGSGVPASEPSALLQRPAELCTCWCAAVGDFGHRGRLLQPAWHRPPPPLTAAAHRQRLLCLSPPLLPQAPPSGWGSASLRSSSCRCLPA